MPNEDDATPGNEAAVEFAKLPLLNPTDTKTRRLLKLGKRRGFITYEEMNAVLLNVDAPSDEIEDLFEALNGIGINVIEIDDDEETTFGAEPAEAPEKMASVDVAPLIGDVLARFVDSKIPFEEYRAIREKLSWRERWPFDESLATLGYVITGAVKAPDGQVFSATIQVLGICSDFTLTKFRGYANNLPTPPKLPANAISADPLRHPLRFRVPVEPDDEIWGFSSSQDSWEHLAGRSGLALVRGKVVIDAEVTIMS